MRLRVYLDLHEDVVVKAYCEGMRKFDREWKGARMVEVSIDPADIKTLPRGARSEKRRRRRARQGDNR